MNAPTDNGQMVCESGRGPRHLMAVRGSVYVYTYDDSDDHGELVACAVCAAEMADEAAAQGAKVTRLIDDDGGDALRIDWSRRPPLLTPRTPGGGRVGARGKA